MERRRSSDEDHDLLVEVHTLLKGMEKNHTAHVADDKEHFSRLYKGQNSLRYYVGVGVGIVIAFEVFFNHIFPVK